jgi:hypothetical protein
MRELKIGDRIYKVYTRSEITEVITIGRVTKTQAISEDDKYHFHININSLGATPIGVRERFSMFSYKLETNELKERLETQNLIRSVSKIDLTKLTKEQLQQIKQIILQ